MTEKKRGRGRPKGSPNKPVMELITERVNLTKNADVYEILCQADIVAQEDEDKAAHGLKVFSETNAAVPRVCQWYFDSKINSTLPEGATPYNKNDAPASDLTETQLRFEFRKFKYFVTEEVPQVRRETMWIELLEGIPNKEAEMIDLVKDGKWPFKNVTLDIVKKAFPNLTIN
jgi:hypothetical protein|tara:strand:- start:1932 stop:2450 length:519 start_codon:yes stop_codon:yes gene_type:complete